MSQTTLLELFPQVEEKVARLPKLSNVEGVFSIACGGIDARNFFALIKYHKIDVLVDARESNKYGNARYSHGDDLPYLCEIHGISYEHLTSLAPSRELRLELQNSFERVKSAKERDPEAWTNYLERYVRSLKDRKVLAEGSELRAVLDSSATNVAFMCACRHPSDCHRRPLVGLINHFIEGLTMHHIMPSDIGMKDPPFASPRKYLLRAIPSAGLLPNGRGQKWEGK